MTEDLLSIIDYDEILVSDCRYLNIDDNDDEYYRQFCDSFVIAHLNIHSLPNKYDDLIDLMNSLNDKNLLPDILLCETFLTENNYKKFSFNNYDLISEFRKNKRLGGVSILIKSHINYVERPELKIFDEGKFESIFLEISQKGRKNIVVGEVYRVPGTNENEFIEKYESIVSKIRVEHKKAIIGTDQNLDYLKINSHTNTMKFFEMNLENCLIPTMYKPTRGTHSSATLIDNIYVDADFYQNTKSFIVKTDISDHYVCITSIQNQILKGKRNIKMVTRKITDDVMRNMNASLCNRNWNELNNMSVHDASEKLIFEIQVVMIHYAPCKTVNRD